MQQQPECDNKNKNDNANKNNHSYKYTITSWDKKMLTFASLSDDCADDVCVDTSGLTCGFATVIPVDARGRDQGLQANICNRNEAYLRHANTTDKLREPHLNIRVGHARWLDQQIVTSRLNARGDGCV
jgi:hypothetical protein